jgi:hypothetical protein
VSNQRATQHTGIDLYLDLLKRSIFHLIYGDLEKISGNFVTGIGYGFEVATAALGHTMIGFSPIDDLRVCIEDVLAKGVPGDFLEAGVWRGGAAIFMRGVLKAHGVTDRTVWCADSFAGLPPPNPDKFPLDWGIDLSGVKELAVSLPRVRLNFARYGLLDDQVRFLKGYFADTMPNAPIDRVAILRLDGDLYESTWQVLENLYPKLSVGGYVIIDDYGGVQEGCRAAVHDYRRLHGISDPIQVSDIQVVFWQRSAAGPMAYDPAAPYAPPRRTVAPDPLLKYPPTPEERLEAETLAMIEQNFYRPRAEREQQYGFVIRPDAAEENATSGTPVPDNVPVAPPSALDVALSSVHDEFAALKQVIQDMRGSLQRHTP